MWLLWTSLLAPGASAQVEACSGPLTEPEWREAMDEAQTAIVAFNGERANQLLDDIVYELRCSVAPVDPRDLGRLARQISLMAFYEQDALEAESWAVLARETIGGAPWDPEVPIPPAYHALLAELPEAERVTADGGLVPPKKGAVLLDGWFLADPSAALGTMHLLQIADKKGRVEQTLWQHGAAFPDEILGPPSELDPPRWYTEPPAPADDPAEAPPVAEPPKPPPVEEHPTEEPLEVEDAVADAEVPKAVTAPRGRTASSQERTKMFESADPHEGCPWKKAPEDVEVHGRSVRVNKHTYPVKTLVDQRRFKAVLRKCGELRAVRRFNRWRDARKKLSFQAPKYKKAMIKALLTEEKRRHRKRATRR